MNTSPIQKQIRNLGQNQIVLYIVLILAVTNVFGYIMNDDLVAVLMFIVVGGLSSYFTKNMIFILAIAMITTNFIVAMNFSREGLVVNAKSDAKEATVVAKVPGKVPGKGKDKGKGRKTDTASVALDPKNHIEPFVDDEDEQVQGTTQADTTVTKKASVSGAGSVNRAKTIGSFYDNMNKFLGSEAMATMTNDTKKLVDKQVELMGHIEKIEPMMNMAGSLLDKLGGKNLGGLLDNMNGFMSK